MVDSILMALLGGALIGVAASIMLIFNGRVTGISGILNGFLGGVSAERLWRGAFLLGLLVGGFFMGLLRPDLFLNTSARSLTLIVIAGLFVGFGTVMGSGCTSGHGVCGISRFSVRSILATVVFIVTGMMVATGLKFLAGGL
ncbi:YeeE/YedE family protein [Bdellovibrio bacteriovorus]|uniref:Uncharacterized protein n=1 Tax=Bdellovibrio bacteriovorus str. Tiberius TaxID=1069642 RepID=K7Z924_BDEBC|nr:YeeE/YedE thiosulfate transporter family protein [Bdellovibrio bacteriovorus]AFY00979.1 hypothetical protein Bdt_1280 [Bdellovibrio bacteriovorus str. Tiberius]